MVKLTAISRERWRAEFWVKRMDTGIGERFIGYGPTSGERKTFALNAARKFWGM